MPRPVSAIRLAALALALGGTALTVDAVRAQPAAALPDWSGVWAMQGPTVFDGATVRPPDGRTGQPGVREFPPYNEEWEAIYRRNIELVREGNFPDPISVCGVPHGFPRIMNVPDVYEFAVTRGAVYILAENGPGIVRIYTDGRTHPAADELWPTYTGASVGHWEGDTLVFTTISLKGASGNDVIVDRTGLSGRYDIDFSAFYPTAALMSRFPFLKNVFEPMGFTSIPRALEDQLGLALVESEAPYDVIVIDQAERP